MVEVDQEKEVAIWAVARDMSGEEGEPEEGRRVGVSLFRVTKGEESVNLVVCGCVQMCENVCTRECRRPKCELRRTRAQFPRTCSAHTGHDRDKCALST